MRLKVRQPKVDPRSARVWLGDLEVTEVLVGLRLSLDPGEEGAPPTTAALVIRPDGLDIDAQTLAHLEAHVRQPSLRDET